jgi:hypothetical protein
MMVAILAASARDGALFQALIYLLAIVIAVPLAKRLA